MTPSSPHAQAIREALSDSFIAEAEDHASAVAVFVAGDTLMRPSRIAGEWLCYLGALIVLTILFENCTC